jgi:hypothetical protein
VRLAKSDAVFFAFAFQVACCSVANLFHTWAAWVTKLSPPHRGTSICPVFADRIVFAVPVLLSKKRILPTWFLAPSFPSSLWKQLHLSATTALTTILFALEAGLGEQVLGFDVVSSPRAGYAPGHLVKSHLDPAPDHGRVVLGL